MGLSVSRPFAVVTGASSGIGYELARQFAEHGFDLLISAKQERIADAEQSLRALGGSVESVRADLATFEGVEDLYQRIQSSGRPLDAIAINAGVGVGGDFSRDTDLQAELNLIHLNVIAPVHLTKRVIKDMLRKDHVVAGSFKNKVQSVAGHALPDPVVADMHRKLSEPGSANR